MSTFTLDESSQSVDFQCYRRPLPINSLLVVTVICLFSCICSAAVIGNLARMLSDDWYMRFAWWWRILVYLSIFLVPLFLIAAFPLFRALQDLSFVKAVSWDKTARQLQITRCLLLGLIRRRQVLPFDEISSMSLGIGQQNGSELALALHVSAEFSPDIELELRVREVDQRTEALDLFFNLARVTGLQNYRIDDNETVALLISAFREASTERQPIPEAQRPARYDLDQPASPMDFPAPLIGAFEPTMYSDWNIRLERWEPGQTIHFLRSAPTLSEMLFVGIAFGLLATIVLGISLADVSGFNRLLSAGVAGVITVPIAGLILRICYPRIETLIDYGIHRIRWSYGIRSSTLTFREVQRVLLRENQRFRKRGGNETGRYPVYQCQLLLESLDGRRWMLTRNDSYSRDRDLQRRALEPLAAAIAQALNVDWQWKGHRDTAIAKFTSSAAPTIVLLGLTGLFGFFGWAYWQQSKTETQWNEIAAQLEQIGTRVTRAGVNIGNEQMFGDGMYVEAIDHQFGDSELVEVLNLLEPVPLYGLDLSHTAVTNAGVEPFAEHSALRYLSLRGTSVTPGVVETLAKMQLSGIDLRDTSVRLQHLLPFREAYGLSVLLISDDHVSPQKMQYLKRIPRLAAVVINDLPTTERWLYQGGEFSDSELRDEQHVVHERLELSAAGEIIFLGR